MNLSNMPSCRDIPGAASLTKAVYLAIQYTRGRAAQDPNSTTGAALAKFLRDCAKLCPQPPKE